MNAITVLWIAGAIALLPLLNLGLGVHPPTFKTEDDPGRYGLRYDRVAFQTADGLTLRGWFIPAASTEGSSREPGEVGCRATIVAGHGYPFDKANILSHVLFLHGCCNLLLIDFRYFGESQGVYTTAGLLETRDVEASVAYLKERTDVDPHRIGAMGFSMSAAAFILARHPDVRAIVADSPYASLEDLIGRQFFFLPGPTKWPLVALTNLYARLLLGVEVEAAAPAQMVRELAVPLLIIHGEADSQIPVEHARQIYSHANPARAELWLVPGADHGQAHAIAGPRYEVRVRTFFERHLSGTAS